MQPHEQPQWLNGPFKGDFTMTLINHVEPLDYAIYAFDYYFGYNNPAYRNLLDRYRKPRKAANASACSPRFNAFSPGRPIFGYLTPASAPWRIPALKGCG